MFIGEYSHSLDEKGRVSIPAKFRPDFGGGVVVTRGLDRCLFVYPKSEWQKMAQKLADLPLGQPKSRAFARLMLAGAWDCELDAQGRVMVPEYLRTFASLSKHAIIAGLYNRLEIWDEDAWHIYESAAEAESDAIAEEIGLV
ncbi:MAG: division/cell wall cluster transcriptional repressor MraZ [Candidatus Sungbacteria bacterium]|nr:division/cell wall cluster transcriptional repressor MraZ [Candidatus Sungbacteria bacterium]